MLKKFAIAMLALLGVAFIANVIAHKLGLLGDK